ncbi:hypothetical protein EJ06DRAFT_39281 [Trichodelitschia bisporula]|uniref:Uncharacterized protein n=1 Tax=Trichodelitschia bisporula TaxID=703511 RepID=A0A6G1HV34_9PEZI|nr:hypothetical protein EJ06DRAFT_39281 [Trichodelitschia bisporula]
MRSCRAYPLPVRLFVCCCAESVKKTHSSPHPTFLRLRPKSVVHAWHTLHPSLLIIKQASIVASSTFNLLRPDQTAERRYKEHPKKKSKAKWPNDSAHEGRKKGRTAQLTREEKTQETPAVRILLGAVYPFPVT